MAAAPIYQVEEESEVPFRFSDQVKYIKEIDMESKFVIEELDSMMEEEDFDEAAVPEWQCI